MAGRPSTKQVAEKIYDDVARSHNLHCVNEALKATKKTCSGVTGRGYGNCMTYNYKKNLLRTCKKLFEQRAKEMAKNLCRNPTCASVTEKQIMAYIYGTPVPKMPSTTTKSPTLKKLTASTSKEADLPSADDSWSYEEEVVFDSGGGSKTGPLGVPVLVWAAGGAFAVFLFMKRK